MTAIAIYDVAQMIRTDWKVYMYCPSTANTHRYTMDELREIIRRKLRQNIGRTRLGIILQSAGVDCKQDRLTGLRYYYMSPQNPCGHELFINPKFAPVHTAALA